MDLSVAHIDVPERAALFLVPYPHGRDAAVGSVMVHTIPDVALGIGRVGTCRDGAVIAVNRRTVELQTDALRCPLAVVALVVVLVVVIVALVVVLIVVGTVVVLVVVLVAVAWVVGFVVKPVVMNRVVVVVFVG